VTERIAGTDWTRGGHGISRARGDSHFFSLAWESTGERVIVKSESASEICCLTAVPREAMLALYAERPQLGPNVGSATERLCFEAAHAADFEADEGALMRELAPLAHAEMTEMKLWKQRCLNAEEELRRIRGEQHAPAPDYRIGEPTMSYVEEHEEEP
jgi:hypothetical protein